jgi:hypothetical protein
MLSESNISYYVNCILNIMKLFKSQNNKEKIDHLIDKLVNKDKCAICGQYIKYDRFDLCGRHLKICSICMFNYHSRDLSIKIQQIREIDKHNNLKRTKFFRFIKYLFSSFYYFK